MKKAFFVFSMIAAVFACAKSGGEKKPPMDGATIYKKYCVVCHGVDGKLGVANAKILPASTLSEAERIEVVTNGRNTMTPFKDILSPEEIKAVVQHTLTLK